MSLSSPTFKRRVFAVVPATLFLFAPIAALAASSSEKVSPQIERGSPNWLLDSTGNVLSLPQKIVLWNRKIDNHSISPETEKYLREFIASHPEELADLKVRLNQWAPFDELGRLTTNKKVSWWWRIFPGIPTTLWTSLTGRILGGDNYNPFTNTISLYSDSPGVALHEAGHAKDFGGKAGRFETDMYAVGRVLPPVALYQEYTASEEAIHYLKVKDDRRGMQESYRTLYPAFGTYAGEFSGVGNIVGAGVGHGIGFWKLRELRMIQNSVKMGEARKSFDNDPLAQGLMTEQKQNDDTLHTGLSSEEQIRVDIEAWKN